MNNILILAILGFGIYIYMKNKENGTGAGSNNNKAINSGNNTTTNNTNTNTNTNTHTNTNANTTTTNNTNASATSFENMTPQQQADIVWKKVQQLINDAKTLKENVARQYREIKKSNPDGCLDKNNPDHHYEDIKEMIALLNDDGTLEYLDSQDKVNLVKHWTMVLNDILNSYYTVKHKI